MTEPSNLSTALSDTLIDSNLKELTVNLAEALSDSLLDDGLVKDIPVLGSVYNLSKFGMTVRDRLFLKKLVYFMTEVANVPAADRAAMISAIDRSSKYQIKVGEKLIYLLDRSEDHENARLIAILFRAFLSRLMSYDDFLRASHAVQSIVAEDLWWFVNDENDTQHPGSVGELIFAGLFSLDERQIRVEDEWDGDTGNRYRVEGDELSASITDLGKKVRDILRARKKGESEPST